MADETSKTFRSLAEAGKYCGTTRQAMKTAIQKGYLKGYKKMIQHPKSKAMLETWHITLEDLEEYRRNKYNSEKRTLNGERLFDYEHDRWSVAFTAKVLSVAWGRPVTITRVYYFLRSGKLRASKKGMNWVINRDDVQRLSVTEAPPQIVQVDVS